jgi:hypothetical protein
MARRCKGKNHKSFIFLNEKLLLDNLVKRKREREQKTIIKSEILLNITWRNCCVVKE